MCKRRRAIERMINMTRAGYEWHRARLEKIKETMSDAELAALKSRSETDPDSLTLDEVGLVFLITRDRIRTIEAEARKNRDDQ
jgi:DNA-directed RNA polymerase sigma subunit (sigma70/sigma32)